MPDRPVVVNTSPLLYLHQVSQLGLLPRLYQQVQVPTAVIQELEVGRSQGIEVPTLGDLAWISPVALPFPELIPNETDLGKGEAEVIAVGLTQANCLLVLDDQLGRQIAQLYGLSCTGTLGILLKAKQLGHIDEVQPLIRQLQHCGMWLGKQLIEQVLKRAGEQVL
ncbi:DUF3368 domain-containing protein [Nodosilinea sp. FACHB-131]|uniref:DUF3368 domain-containing protein n=1 Tax=Cyanophyceae TaxID=3028117 RepID=UPI001683F1FE|nr:DUF3368 domain-containing protein [Nodosilinea sp. FACHB-131]MBD1876574.1 DUF3368 domain-containing protein [Nodosilinea sp. FACHB-131]